MDCNNQLNINIPSPVEIINHPLYESNGLSVSIKREDLIHNQISGNKWRKLNHNISYAKDKCYKGILTFGGAFSNHLHACAYACKASNLQMIAMVRGDQFDDQNPTLNDLKECNVEIKFLDRATYRLKEDPTYVDSLMQEYPDFYIVPEGGNNDLGISGILDMVVELDSKPDHIFVSAGRGSTAIGIAKGFENNPETKIHIVSCVKDSGLSRYIKKYIKKSDQVVFHDDYTFGGFAKSNESLIKFSNEYFEKTGIPLDTIYNSKTIFALHDLIAKDYFKSGEEVLLVHTGGLQGNRGHNYRYRNKPEMQIKY